MHEKIEERAGEDGMKEGGREGGLDGEGGGGQRKATVGRGARCEGWKSIPLDGVTSRAQLAPARVSFRRGFRILAAVDWRFLPAVSLLSTRRHALYVRA